MISFNKNSAFIPVLIILLVLIISGVVLLQYIQGGEVPTKTQNAEGKFCGGIAANLPEFQCPPGYDCKLDGDYPDASGVCVKR